MTTMAKYNPPWECSSSYEEHYSERRNRVARTLWEWGSRTNTQWPTTARHISLTDVSTQVWKHLDGLVDLGRQSINRKHYSHQMQELFPSRTWDSAAGYQVYWTEHIEGNVVFPDLTVAQLVGYIVGSESLHIIRVGCDHPNRNCIKTANCYREYECPSCGRRWGEDSSG